VNPSYTLLGATRFTVGATRDVQYSYDVEQAYYLQTGFNGSVAQQIFGPFDVVVRGGAQTLAYRDRASVPVAASNRVDHVRSYGGGVGYHMGRDLRLGFNIDKDERTSVLSFRQYTGLRFGSSVTYGL
jgi:hypothetical protein